MNTIHLTREFDSTIKSALALIVLCHRHRHRHDDDDPLKQTRTQDDPDGLLLFEKDETNTNSTRYPVVHRQKQRDEPLEKRNESWYFIHSMMEDVSSFYPAVMMTESQQNWKPWMDHQRWIHLQNMTRVAVSIALSSCFSLRDNTQNKSTHAKLEKGRRNVFENSNSFHSTKYSPSLFVYNSNMMMMTDAAQTRKNVSTEAPRKNKRQRVMGEGIDDSFHTLTPHNNNNSSFSSSSSYSSYAASLDGYAKHIRHVLHELLLSSSAVPAAAAAAAAPMGVYSDEKNRVLDDDEEETKSESSSSSLKEETTKTHDGYTLCHSLIHDILRIPMRISKEQDKDDYDTYVHNSPQNNENDDDSYPLQQLVIKCKALCTVLHRVVLMDTTMSTTTTSSSSRTTTVLSSSSQQHLSLSSLFTITLCQMLHTLYHDGCTFHYDTRKNQCQVILVPNTFYTKLNTLDTTTSTTNSMENNTMKLYNPYQSFPKKPLDDGIHPQGNKTYTNGSSRNQKSINKRNIMDESFVFSSSLSSSSTSMVDVLTVNFIMLLEAITTLRLHHSHHHHIHDSSTQHGISVSMEAQKILSEFQMYMSPEMTMPLSLSQVPSFYIQYEKKEEATMRTTTTTNAKGHEKEVSNLQPHTTMNHSRSSDNTTTAMKDTTKPRRSWMNPSVAFDDDSNNNNNNSKERNESMSHPKTTRTNMEQEPQEMMDHPVMMMRTTERMTSSSKLMLRVCIYDLIQQVSSHVLNG